MGLEIKQTAKLAQQVIMTPQLQQAIKLLQLNRLELLESISQELLENPLLEEADALDESPELPADANDQWETSQNEEEWTETALSSSSGSDFETARDLETEAADSRLLDEVQVNGDVREDFDWENYLGEYSSAPARDDASFYEEKEPPAFESIMSRPSSLRENLLWQLRLSNLDSSEMELGAAIIGNLDQDGYLIAELSDLADVMGLPVTQAEKVLQVIQTFDPLGIAARNLRECLIIQATELYPGEDLVHEILENHLPDLERGALNEMAKKLGVSQAELNQAISIIKRLEPKPGQLESDEEPQYITPDIYVYKVGDEFYISLNEDGMPKLKVNNFYRDSLTKNTPAETREYVQTKLRNAMWFIRSIHQRQRTIYKVTESIVKFQRDFLEKGVAYLRPLILRDVAEDVSMHESTVSRVTTHKYMHTPQGVFELKFFFNSGLSSVHGGDAISSEAVKNRIRQLVAAEPPGKPLSDQVIGELLKKENIDIARRTVAKYREMMNIPPSSRRRRMAKGKG